MLPVLLLILKIIGIILALLVALVVLLLCILLFMPIRYQVQASYQNSFESLFVVVKMSWIFYLIRGFFKYEDKDMNWQFKFAWKEILNEKEELQKQGTKQRNASDEKHVVKQIKKPTVIHEPGERVAYDNKQEVIPIINEDLDESIINAKKDNFFDKTKKLYNKIAGWYCNIMKHIKNIKYTILKIYDNIKLLLTKKDKLMEFLTDQSHKSAFEKFKQVLLKFLKKLKPKKFILSGIFGFEDPSLTGKVLAGLSILYPFVGKHIQVMPIFEEEILQGDLYIKGKIRLSYIVIAAIQLLVNKDVRKTIKDIRQLKR